MLSREDARKTAGAQVRREHGNHEPAHGGFDMRYGTDTVRWVEINALSFESEHKKDGFAYIPSPVNPLRTLLRRPGLPKDGDVPNLAKKVEGCIRSALSKSK